MILVIYEFHKRFILCFGHIVEYLVLFGKNLLFLLRWVFSLAMSSGRESHFVIQLINGKNISTISCLVTFIVQWINIGRCIGRNPITKKLGQSQKRWENF